MKRTGGTACLTFLLLCAAVRAQEPTSWMPVIAKLASALSRNDAVGALETFDHKAAGYGAVEAAVSALAAQANILCGLDVVAGKADGEVQVLDVDWYLQLTSQSEASHTERRRQRVELRMRQYGASWKILSLTPLSVLDPIHIN